jgi:hypothetical protein
MSTPASLRLLPTVLACAALLAAAGDASAVVAGANATVQPGGPRTGTSGTNFFNIEGSSNGSFSSFGVIDFTLAPSPSDSVSGLTLGLTESNAAFTKAGSLTFYVVSDSTTSIVAGSSPLSFTGSTTGLGSQLGTQYLLGTGSFNSNGTTPTGALDNYTFTLSGGAQTFVNAVSQAGGKLRFVIAPNDATVAATFAGATNSATASHQVLTLITSAVPEPSTWLSMGIGVIALGTQLRRRSR